MSNKNILRLICFLAFILMSLILPEIIKVKVKYNVMQGKWVDGPMGSEFQLPCGCYNECKGHNQPLRMESEIKETGTVNRTTLRLVSDAGDDIFFTFPGPRELAMGEQVKAGHKLYIVTDDYDLVLIAQEGR